MKNRRKPIDAVSNLISRPVTSNREALLWLHELKGVYSGLTVDKVYVSPSPYEMCVLDFHLSYLWYLWDMSINLKHKQYMACHHNLQNLIYFQNKYLLQSRVWYNLVNILSALEDDTVFLHPERVPSARKQISLLLGAVYKYCSQRKSSNQRDSINEIFCNDQKDLLFRENYTTARESIDRVMKICDDEKHDKTAVLDHIMHMVRNDIKYDCFTDIIYAKDHQTIQVGLLMPMYYELEDGEVRKIEHTDSKKKIDFSETPVIAVPWNYSRLAGNASYLKDKEFVYHPNNHFGQYFQHIGICYISNGNHSISQGVQKNKGFIYVDAYDESPMFEHIHSDGAYWINSHTRKTVIPVIDFRFALLYDLAHRKHRLGSNKMEYIL